MVDLSTEIQQVFYLSQIPRECEKPESKKAPSEERKEQIKRALHLFKSSREYEKLKSKRTPSEERKEQITQALAKMTALCRLPHNFPSSVGFKRFMNIVEPEYGCPSSYTVVKRLQRAEDEVKCKVQQQLETCEFVALDTDCWISPPQDNHVNINVHVINEEWAPQTLNLCTEEFRRIHTVENLADGLEVVAMQWDLYGKVSCIVSGNAENMLRAVNFSVEFTVTCAAHSISPGCAERLGQEGAEGAQEGEENCLTLPGLRCRFERS
ncbi:PREDICTED: zinc finger BED domain-containing protein 6-like [Dinoponera quadriceps]|uniref:Zinc finger BED domain-containing protein 6-like n=1 Tax=Dinoponera quadriceps TaxID=609295 RepID=A0A6P3Y9I2_DINQU|nr:PREDICTED: zinc finger BED domain-containing protein 6-like [Dinoponera quadriceps]